MFTKVRAARLAARSGAATIVVAGAAEHVITEVIAGAELGTYFLPDVEPLVARNTLVSGQLQVKGQLRIGYRCR